jgi:hypothetical protein
MLDKSMDSSGTTFQTTEAAPMSVKVGDMYRRKTEQDHVTVESISPKWVFYTERGRPMPEKGRLSPEDAEAKVQSGEWTKTDYSEPEELVLDGSVQHQEMRANLRKLAAFTKNEALAKEATLDLFNLGVIKAALIAMAGAILATGDPRMALIWGVATAWVQQQELALKKSSESDTPGREFEYSSGPGEFPYMG